MKKILLGMLLMVSFVYSSELIHPLDFNGTKAEKEKVVKLIEVYVKEVYSKIGMGDAMTLRMMEAEELRAFKVLTKVESRKLLDSVMKTYCAIGMCTYTTINMMYIEQDKASKGKLEW